MSTDTRPVTQILARDLVRADANKNGWNMIEMSFQSDVFSRGSEELVMVWTRNHPMRLAQGTSYRSHPDMPPAYDRSMTCIVNARATLARTPEN